MFCDVKLKTAFSIAHTTVVKNRRNCYHPWLAARSIDLAALTQHATRQRTSKQSWLQCSRIVSTIMHSFAYFWCWSSPDFYIEANAVYVCLSVTFDGALYFVAQTSESFLLHSSLWLARKENISHAHFSHSVILSLRHRKSNQLSQATTVAVFWDEWVKVHRFCGPAFARRERFSQSSIARRSILIHEKHVPWVKDIFNILKRESFA